MANQDFLKKIKGLFVVEDSSTTSEASNTQTPATPSAPTPQVTVQHTVTNVFTPTVITSGNVSDKVLETLSKALESNNLDGFDYFEYRASLLSLSKMPMDEQTRFQSAFAMAQTMGATPTKLIETANHYLNVLTNEELKFKQALDNQKSSNLTAKEQESQNLKAIIGQKAEQIKKLTEEIQQHQTQIESLQQQINEMGAKVETAKNDFSATYSQLISQIQGDITNMQRYLK